MNGNIDFPLKKLRAFAKAVDDKFKEEIFLYEVVFNSFHLIVGPVFFATTTFGRVKNNKNEDILAMYFLITERH